MRNWFSGRTVASKATGGSSILPCRTDERSEGVRNEQGAGRPGWRIEGRSVTTRGGVAQISSKKLCVTESVIAVLPFRTRKEKSKSFGSPRFARRLIRIQFWVQKRIGGFAFWGEEKFLINSRLQEKAIRNGLFLLPRFNLTAKLFSATLKAFLR